MVELKICPEMSNEQLVKESFGKISTYIPVNKIQISRMDEDRRRRQWRNRLRRVYWRYCQEQN